MIAAWASLTTGWALTHAWSVTAILTALLVLGVIFIVIPLTAEPKGTRNAPRPSHPPAWAGVTRAARRAASHARRLPGAITWAWRTPVRTKTLGPGAGTPPPVTAATPVPKPQVASPAPDNDGTQTARWLQRLRHDYPGLVSIRSRLAVLGALTDSGRAAPGHTAASPHGEPGRPAGGLWHCIWCETDTRDAAHPCQRCGLPRCGECGWCPDEVDFRTHPPERPDGMPPPHDPALWQPRAEQTDWSLLAVIAPDLAAERRDAQTQAGA